eukprot:g28413.t1
MHDKKTDIVRGLVERIFPAEEFQLGTYEHYISFMKETTYVIWPLGGQPPTLNRWGQPMDVAVALSLLISEVTQDPWRQRVCSFSADPYFVSLPDPDTTNLAERAAQNQVPGDQLPELLVVFSDMQFDESISSMDPWATTHEKIKTKFRTAGYGEYSASTTWVNLLNRYAAQELIIYWNLRYSSASGRVPTPALEKDVVMLSGYSQGLLKSFLKQKLEAPAPLEQTPELQVQFAMFHLRSEKGSWPVKKTLCVAGVLLAVVGLGSLRFSNQCLNLDALQGKSEAQMNEALLKTRKKLLEVKNRSLAEKTILKAMTKAGHDAQKDWEAFGSAPAHGGPGVDLRELDGEEAGNAECAFNILEAFVSVVGMGDDINGIIRTCPPPRDGESELACQVDASILVAWVGNAAAKISLAASNCALTLNVDSVCAAGVSGLVAAFGEISAGACLGAAEIVSHRSWPVKKTLCVAGVLLAVVGLGSLRFSNQCLNLDALQGKSEAQMDEALLKTRKKLLEVKNRSLAEKTILKAMTKAGHDAQKDWEAHVAPAHGGPGLVAAFGEISAGACLGAAVCTPTPPSLTTTKISVLGDQTVRTPEAGRRLLIGEGPVGNGVQCGLAINKAVNVNRCGKFATEKNPLNVLKGIPDALCTVDIAGAVAYISSIRLQAKNVSIPLPCQFTQKLLSQSTKVDASILVAWVGNAAAKISLAASNCALSLNVDSVCAAGVTGLVAAFGEISAGACLGAAVCTPTPPSLTTTKISVLGDQTVRTPEAGRRLLIGEGPVGNGVQCGLAINKAVNVNRCGKFATEKNPLNVLKGIPDALCTVDIAGAVAYISQVVTFINLIVVHCQDT